MNIEEMISCKSKYPVYCPMLKTLWARTQEHYPVESVPSQEHMHARLKGTPNFLVNKLVDSNAKFLSLEIMSLMAVQIL